MLLRNVQRKVESCSGSQSKVTVAAAAAAAAAVVVVVVVTVVGSEHVHVCGQQCAWMLWPQEPVPIHVLMSLVFLSVFLYRCMDVWPYV